MDFAYVALYLAANAFHIYVFQYLFRILLGQPSCPKLEAACFIAMYALNSSMFLLLNNPYLNLATSIIPLILISFLYENSIRNRLLISLMTYVSSMLLDSVSYNIGSLFLDEAADFIGVFTNIISSLILFLLAQIIKRVRFRNKNDTLFLSHWVMIIIVPICSMIAVALAFHSGYDSLGSIVVVAILLLINIIIFWLFDKLSEYYQALYEKQLLSEQNHAYSQQLHFIRENNEAVRELRHDIKNHLNYLTEYIRSNNFAAALNYLQTIGAHLHPQKEYVCSGNGNIDSFLNYKLFAISKFTDQISAEIVIPEELDYPDFDLCIVLGNLLDNALEALGQMSVPSNRMLSIRMRFDRGALYIRVQNTYEGILKKSYKHGKTVYCTTKKDTAEHGWGIFNTMRVVESYGGTLNITDQDNIYTVELILFSPETSE